MYVADLEAARLFFEKYFNANSGERYHNTRSGFMSYFLSFDSGARLEIMKKPLVVRNSESCPKIGYNHIAFSVGSKGRVNELTKQLSGDGFTVASPPRITGDGYYESCIVDIDGNLIEITI